MHQPVEGEVAVAGITRIFGGPALPEPAAHDVAPGLVRVRELFQLGLHVDVAVYLIPIHTWGQGGIEHLVGRLEREHCSIHKPALQGAEHACDSAVELSVEEEEMRYTLVTQGSMRLAKSIMFCTQGNPGNEAQATK